MRDHHPKTGARFSLVQRLFKRSLLAGAALLAISGSLIPSAIADEAAFPGQRSRWNGFDRFDFQVDGKPAIVVSPHKPAQGRPWLWRGEFFGHRPEPDIALLGHGFHVVYLGIPDQFGSPAAVASWNAFYRELTAKYGFSARPALIGVSRGGLYCYNWAAENPDKVACIYGDAPVCDLKSWPLGKGEGTGNSRETPKLFAVYAVENETQLLAKALNPVDRLEPLARAKIPLLHVYGDADTGVPWKENTGLLAERYKKLGGEITLIAKPGVGHVHGLDDASPLVEFILRHAGPAAAAPVAPLPLGTNRELFVDRRLIERLDGAWLQLHEPRDEGVALKMDKPWEGPFSGYTTVIQDGGRYLMYYRGRPSDGRDGDDHERTCLAESADGVTWTRPELGQFEFQGDKANNLVLANMAPLSHNFCPFLDTRPGVPAAERFKAVAGVVDSLDALISEDGRRWKRMQESPILAKSHVPFPHTHLFDSQNLVFWSASEQKYVCYFRVWDGLRRIARSESDDFRSWSPAVLMKQTHDDGAGPRPTPAEHLYTNQTSPYFRAPQIYVAIAARFFPDRRVLSEEQARAIGVNPQYFSDTSDAVFMTSRGGDVYDRTFLEGFLRPGVGPRNWVSRTNYPALNVVPTGPSEMSLYVNQDYAQPTAHIRRYSCRLDGFASLRAGAAAGELLTRPLTFAGQSLEINFATSAGGGLRFEIQDLSGAAYPGFSLAECQETIGNEISRVVRWKAGQDLSSIAGKPARLRVVIKDADLFAIRFADGKGQ